MKTNYLKKGVFTFTCFCIIFLFVTEVHSQVYDFDFTEYKVKVTESNPTSASNLNALFDNNLSTAYSVPAGGQKVIVELQYPILLSGYCIKSSAVGASVEWSATGATWNPVVIEESIDHSGTYYHTADFAMDKAFACKYYRLSLNSGTVSEWQLFGVPVISAEYDFPEDLIAKIGGTPTLTWGNTTFLGDSQENIFNRKFGNGNEYRATYKVDSAPIEVKYAFKSAQTVMRYSISTYNTGTLHVTRSPKTWKLHGSNDGKSWTELDTRTEFLFPFSEGTYKRSVTMEFMINKPASYSTYRFTIEGQHVYLDLLEIQMFGDLINTAIPTVRYEMNGINISAGNGTMTLSSESEDIYYVVYNTGGSLVYADYLKKDVSSTISLPAGLYVVKTKDSSKKVFIFP